MKRGFTLIELLAVIVILAIIALIATPIVLNIIKNTKVSATIRSAENYISAVEQAIARKQLDGTNFDSDILYVMADGNLCMDTLVSDACTNSSKKVMVDVNGKLPTRGTITFINGKIDKVTNLKFDNYYVNKTNGKLIAATKAVSTSICTMSTSLTHAGIGVLGTVGHEYDLGVEYKCIVDNSVTPKTFYVLEDGDNTTLSKGTTGTAGSGEVSLIMDNNVGDKTAWSTKEDYIAAGGQNILSNTDGGACQYGGRCYGNDKGPITANNMLVTSTNDWRSDLNIKLPTYNQLKLPNNSISSIANWLTLNVVTGGGYWTFSVSSEVSIWSFSQSMNSITDQPPQALTFNVRPVITISKTKIS